MNVPFFSRWRQEFPQTIDKVSWEAHQAWFGASAATVITAFGMFLENLIGRSVTGVPQWPSFLSGITALVIFFILWRIRHRSSVLMASGLYTINVAVVCWVFYVTNPYYAEGIPQWLPYQGNKLGCLIAAIVAPSMITGCLSISAHVGIVLWQLMDLSPIIRERIGSSEPWATMAFGFAGIVTLAFRHRRLSWERKYLEARLESQSLKNFRALYCYTVTL